MNQNMALAKELYIIKKIILEAGAIALQFQSNQLNIRNKDEDQYNPVTDADIATSHFLVTTIKQYFPDDIVISEEAIIPDEKLDNKRFWLIDPIDGTKEFIKGINEWSLMVGLVIAGRPVLGVVYQPVLKHLYYAVKGQGAFFANKDKTSPLKVREIQNTQHATLIQSRSHWSGGAKKIAEQLGIRQFIQQGSIGLKFGMIAKGKADLYMNFSGHCHFWDLCGPEIILQEAGGHVFLMSGKKILYNIKEMRIKDGFCATSAILADQLRQYFCR